MSRFFPYILLFRGKENHSFYRGLRYTVEPLFRGHPRDQGKCHLNGGWAGVC